MFRNLTLWMLVGIAGCGGSEAWEAGWTAAEQPREGARETFDLRAVVAGSTEFKLNASSVAWRRVDGEAPRDSGSSATGALPAHAPEGLEITQLSGRQRLEVIERPSAKNDWSLVLRIDDRPEGEDEYHVRLGWRSDEAAFLSAVSPVLLERCHREVQVRFQERFPNAAFAWDRHSVRPAGVLSYLNGEATAAQDNLRIRVGWECFVDPRHNAVREADFKVLGEQTP